WVHVADGDEITRTGEREDLSPPRRASDGNGSIDLREGWRYAGSLPAGVFVGIWRLCDGWRRISRNETWSGHTKKGFRGTCRFDLEIGNSDLGQPNIGAKRNSRKRPVSQPSGHYCEKVPKDPFGHSPHDVAAELIARDSPGVAARSDLGFARDCWVRKQRE